MCTVSSNIKFCSCIGDVYNLKHRWILFRFCGGKEEIIVGMPMFSTDMIDDNFEVNKVTIENRLNEPDAFDLPMNFIEKDKLSVQLFCKESKEGYDFEYNYEYLNGVWIYTENYCFEYRNTFDEVNAGKIKTPFMKL
ncbi:MAG: hypothetical protein ACKVQV_03975 [Bacteroidia bacterium]